MACARPPTRRRSLVDAVSWPTASPGRHNCCHRRRCRIGLEVAAGGAASAAFRLEVTRSSMGTVLGGGSFADQVDGGAIKVGGDGALARKFSTWFDVPFTKKPEVVVR